MEKNYLLQLDRTAITVSSLSDDPRAETRFWLSKTPAERLIALELLRNRTKNYDSVTSRLQRFLTIIERV